LSSVQSNTRFSITIANTALVDLSARVFLHITALLFSASSNVAVTLQFRNVGVVGTVTCNKLTSKQRVTQVCCAHQRIVTHNRCVQAARCRVAGINGASRGIITERGNIDRDVVAANLNTSSVVLDLRAEVNCASIVVIAVEREVLASVEGIVTAVDRARVFVVAVEGSIDTVTISRVTS